MPTIDPSFTAIPNFRFAPSSESTTGITEGVPGIMNLVVVVIVLTFKGCFASGCRSHVISIAIVSAVAMAGNKYRRSFCKIADLFSKLGD